MPIIVFEGPDESGKTTFALSLYQTLSPVFPGRIMYQRSPMSDHDWSPNYSHYLADQANINGDYLVIQDRVPEIGESTYGIWRGDPRGRGYLYEVYNWMNQEVLMVFCKGFPTLDGYHKDTEGNPLANLDHQAICLLYEQAYFNIRSAMLHGHPHHFRAIKYDRQSKTSWLDTAWTIRSWLSELFPDDESEISKALSYSVDSAFPMPKEGE